MSYTIDEMDKSERDDFEAQLRRSYSSFNVPESGSKQAFKVAKKWAGSISKDEFEDLYSDILAVVEVSIVDAMEAMDLDEA